jgi:hypothetical protein
VSERAARPPLLEQMGGVAGLVHSALPSIAFVVADAALGLQGGIWFAVGVAVAITLWRLWRKESIQPAISGLFGVGLSVFIAYQTGSGKGYFLVGIWTSVVLAGIFLVSILVRWPLVGVIWHAASGTGHAWRDDKPSRLGYDIATLALVAIFVSRFVVEQWLYSGDSVGWLAFARIVMGYPLSAVALLVAFWAIRRSGRRLKILTMD